MPKRQREPDLDEASEELIASIQDADALESGLDNLNAQKASVKALFEDAEAGLLAEFQTDDPESLSERDKIRFNTKLEYEKGLRDDRLKEIDEQIIKYKDEHFKQCNSRKRQRMVDRQIAECAKLAEEDAGNSNWKLIGKVKHAQTVLNEKVEEMSSTQKEKYIHVLKELKRKGWRVLRTDKEENAHI